MVGTKDWLFDFDDSFIESGKLGDDSKTLVMGKQNTVVYWWYDLSDN